MYRDYENIMHPQLIRGLARDDIVHIVNSQVGIANYLLPPEGLEPKPDRTYTDNKSLWGAMLEERLRATITLKLKDFFLSEWFPRSPGLFYTPEAEGARADAMNFVLSAPRLSQLRGIDDADRERHAELAYTTDATPDYMYIFDPYGKISMLKGGIGCIRLKDKVVESGRVWFLSASSTLVAHEGFPVALPNQLYERYIDQIASEGALSCTLIGRLQFLPQPLVKLFEDYSSIPQLYLLAEKIIPLDIRKTAQRRPLRVSVAVSFQSEYEGQPRMYASYVTFDPGQAGSLKTRIDWLENTYVSGMYQGRIVTDFDEQTIRFRGAVFSLEKVMNNGLQKSEVATFIKTVNIYGDANVLIERLNQLNARRIDQMTQERAINIGSGATVTAPVIIADRIESSFNTVTNSSVNDEVKTLLEQLIKQVNEVSKSKATSTDVAEAMARDVETLSKEVTSSKPRRQWYEISSDGLKQAAINIGEVGKPVLETVAKLMPLLLRFFP